MKPVRLVIGAGAGRFALEGYQAVLCRRTDEEGLRRSVENIEERVAEVEAEIGPIEVVVYNPGARTGIPARRLPKPASLRVSAPR